jgi:hypothetical protein
MMVCVLAEGCAGVVVVVRRWSEMMVGCGLEKKPVRPVAAGLELDKGMGKKT